MEALEIIPNLFFDLIARVVPGAVFLALFMYGNGRVWRTVVERLWPVAATNSPTYGFIAFFGAAYISGHIISAAVNLLEWMTTRLTQRRIDSALGKDTKPLKKFWEDLTWLRINQPDDTVILGTKIFAEYTMYFGLAAVFLLAAVGSLFCVLNFGEAVRLWSPILVLLALFAVCMYRGTDQQAKFALTVHGLRHEATEAKKQPAQK